MLWCCSQRLFESVVHVEVVLCQQRRVSRQQHSNGADQAYRIHAQRICKACNELQNKIVARCCPRMLCHNSRRDCVATASVNMDTTNDYKLEKEKLIRAGKLPQNQTIPATHHEAQRCLLSGGISTHWPHFQPVIAFV